MRTNKKAKIKQDQILSLWKRIQNGDRNALREMIAIHNDHFPHQAFWINIDNHEDPSWKHSMFLHLEQISKK